MIRTDPGERGHVGGELSPKFNQPTIVQKLGFPIQIIL